MNLGIIFLTYQRTPYALRTIRGIEDNLIFQGNIIWYVADDGSSKEHIEAIKVGLDSLRIFENHQIGDFRSERKGYGANINWAQDRASVKCDAFLVLEDDWVLSEPFDVTPHVNLLTSKPNEIGFVRIAHLPIGLEFDSVGHNGRMYLNVRKNKQYAFSGNPHLKTPNTHKHYGPYPTGKNPGDTEIAYDSIVRNKSGPGILWPLEIGEKFLFEHIGEKKSY